uniref:CCT-beta n=1 Tax=Albugo laibachii Nc14 TaxID=890382 RepID=F0WUH6_9STRA|nr:PREDICTED: similar to chaperonin containing tcomplex polypeptide 1 putative [Albugo laibachii Nc14]CCA27958.1 Tcomplex protein 1 subunit beta putative [Albugo laibachii Nc14]|eukprot:CCA27958.1 Tcomplex protein 1 subunit beta putative [Albugo laibachii Nc14]
MQQGLLDPESQIEKGENARMSSFVGAIAIADMVKTTLGPKGMDKILQPIGGNDHSISVTNDGATILRSIYVDNAAAKVLVDIAKIQDDEVGDGTTSVAVLCGELLREAEKLIDQRIHPQTIIEGWRIALETAHEALQANTFDHGDDPIKFREDLLNIAKTTLSSKLLTQEKEHFAELAVNAVLRLKGSNNLDYIQIIKKQGGALKDSYLDDGFLLDKKIGIGQPRRIENAKILIANTGMDTDKIKIYGARVKVDSMDKVSAIEDAEKKRMKQKCEKIAAFGINCFINRQLIYNYPEQIFTEKGIMAIEHADFDGIERLAAVLGGEIVSTFDHPEKVALGECKLIEEILIGEDRLIRFSGVKTGQACSVILRGASIHVLDEAERSLHDALAVLTQTVQHTQTIMGGGCTEILMAQAIDSRAISIPGKKALAMEAFARALRTLPAILADNGGFDSAELVTQLRAEHHNGKRTAGLNLMSGQVDDMETLGIREAFRSKKQVLFSAAEAAEMILRVDDIIKCAPRKRSGRQ